MSIHILKNKWTHVNVCPSKGLYQCYVNYFKDFIEVVLSKNSYFST